MIAILFAAVVAAAPPCNPAPGAEALFTQTTTRVVWVGEVHGSVEQPALFADLVCAATMTGRPLIVGLERSGEEQAGLDTFMASDGGETARTALLNGVTWIQPMQDGRGSQAMLALTEQLRLLHRAGSVRSVAMIDPVPSGPPPATIDYGARDRRMADAVAQLETTDPKALILVYSGNGHARKASVTVRGQTYPLAAYQLPEKEVVSVYLSGGVGMTWDCEAGNCGPHRSGFKESPPRGVVGGSPLPGFDFTAYTGLPSTPSPPAVKPAP